jgi:hypothetical protein
MGGEVRLLLIARELGDFLIVGELYSSARPRRVVITTTPERKVREAKGHNRQVRSLPSHPVPKETVESM